MTYAECMFVALDIQDAMRMRHIVICSLIFPHYLIHGTISVPQEKSLLNVKCVYKFPLQLCQTHLILGILRDLIVNVCWSSCEVSVLLVIL